MESRRPGGCAVCIIAAGTAALHIARTAVSVLSTSTQNKINPTRGAEARGGGVVNGGGSFPFQPVQQGHGAESILAGWGGIMVK